MEMLLHLKINGVGHRLIHDQLRYVLVTYHMHKYINNFKIQFILFLSISCLIFKNCFYFYKFGLFLTNKPILFTKCTKTHIYTKLENPRREDTFRAIHKIIYGAVIDKNTFRGVGGTSLDPLDATPPVLKCPPPFPKLPFHLWQIRFYIKKIKPDKGQTSSF